MSVVSVEQRSRSVEVTRRHLLRQRLKLAAHESPGPVPPAARAVLIVR